MKKGRLYQFRQAAKAKPQNTESYLEAQFWQNIAQDISDLITLYCASDNFIENVGANIYAAELSEFRRSQKSHPSTYKPNLKRAYSYAYLGKSDECAEAFAVEKMKWLDEMCGANDEEFKHAVINATLSGGEGMIERFMHFFLYNETAYQDLAADLAQKNRPMVVMDIVTTMQRLSQIDGEFIRFTIEKDSGTNLPNEITAEDLQPAKNRPEGALLTFPVRDKLKF
jgi:hypothetical protein